VRRDAAVPTGTVFMAFAYVEAAANLLTNPKLDPFGKIPEYKYCAVVVEPATTPPPLARYGVAAELAAADD
jgi:formate dehydrogenase major subunit